MQLPITYTDREGVTTTVVAYPADIVAWERHAKRRVSDFAQGVGMEDLAYLAWSATRREPGKRPPFDVWLDQLVAIEEADDVDDVESADPTKPEPSPG